MDNDNLHNTLTKPSILLVEDDETSISLTEIYLKNNYELESIKSGKDAVDRCKSKKFDLILMDINLGSGISGLEALMEIRNIADYKNTPIIAFTAFAMRGDKEKFISAGCTHYLSKPFTKTQLIDIIKEALKK